MKAIKINDNLYINVDAVYSIQHTVNTAQQDAWNKAVEDAFKSDSFKQYMQHNNIEDPQENIEEIYNIIISQIGECPQAEHVYTVLLSSGVKVSVDENIYNEIKKYMDSTL